MTGFGIAITASLVVAGVVYYFGWKKDRAEKMKHNAATVDSDEFDATVGELPDPSAARVALLELDDDNFDARALSQSPLPIVVKFFTKHCPGCIAQKPLMEQAAAKFAGKAIFYEVDCDLADKLPDLGKITKVPTSFFINPATKTQLAHVGALNVEEIGEVLAELAAESAKGTTVKPGDEFPYLLR